MVDPPAADPVLPALFDAEPPADPPAPDPVDDDEGHDDEDKKRPGTVTLARLAVLGSAALAPAMMVLVIGDYCWQIT